MKKSKKAIVTILYIIILLPFFKTDYIFFNMPNLNNILGIMRILSAIISLIIAIKNRYISKKIIYLVIFASIIIFSTIVHSGNITTVINYFITFLTIAYLIDYNKKDILFLNSMLICFEIIIYINFISMILYPQGLYTTGNILIGTATQNWFLGFKNVMITFFLPAFTISYIYMNITGRKIRHYILSIIILLSTFMSGSSTSIVGISILFLFSIFDIGKKYYNTFNIKTYMKVSYILFFIIVIFRLQYMFSFFLEDILKKDLTFTHRTVLWDITINKIIQYPLLGNGWVDADIRRTMYNSQTIITAHNQILEYLFLGGFLCIIALFLLCNKSEKEIKNFYRDKNIQIISLSFFVFMIINLTEVFLNPLIMIVFFIYIFAKNYILEDSDERN